MNFDMTIDKADYAIINEVHSVVGDFYVAARRYVAMNPELSSAMANAENKTFTDEKITHAVTTMKFQLAEQLLTTEFSHETPAQQIEILKEIEAKCAIVEAQAFDHFIGILERFTSAAVISTHILPDRAKLYPLVYSKVMDKYGLKRSSAATLHHWSLQQG